MKNFPKQQGVSLIELLITMALGSVVLIGLISLYISDKKTYRLAQASAHMQEDGRTAMYFMSRDIRMAGYAGCGRLKDIKMYPDAFYAENSLIGWHDGRSSAIMHFPIVTKKPKSNTDALHITAADPYSVTL